MDLFHWDTAPLKYQIIKILSNIGADPESPMWISKQGYSPARNPFFSLDLRPQKSTLRPTEKSFDSFGSSRSKEKEDVEPLGFYVTLFASLFFLMLFPLEVHSKGVKSASVELVEGDTIWDATQTLVRTLPLTVSTFNKAWDKSFTVIRGNKVAINEVDWVDPGTKVFWNDKLGLFEIDLIGTGTIRDFQIYIALHRSSWGNDEEQATLLAISPVEQEKVIVIAPVKQVEVAAITPEKRKSVLAGPSVPRPVRKKRTRRFLFDSGVEIGGLILDQTKTHLGYVFYRLFTSHWERGEDDPFVITITEQSNARSGVRVFVKVNDTIVHQSMLRARGQNFEETAKQGVSDTLKYINARRIGT